MKNDNIKTLREESGNFYWPIQKEDTLMKYGQGAYLYDYHGRVYTEI